MFDTAKDSNMLGEFYYLVDDCIVVTTEWSGTQRVAHDTIRDSSVSTLFLGMDHIGGLFETMVFGGPIDGFQIRCATAAQARAIHARVVAVLNSVNWLQYHLDGNIREKILLLIKIGKNHA